METGFNRYFKAKDPLMTKESDERLTRIGLSWFFSALVVGYLVQYLELDYMACDFCVWTMAHLPSIQVLSEGAPDPNAMRFVVLFHALTSPLWLVLMWVLAHDFRRTNLVWWGYPFFTGAFLFTAYASVLGISFGGPEARGFFGKTYHAYLPISVMVTTAAWVGMVHLIYFFWYYLVLVRFGRWLGAKIRTK